MIPVQLSPAEIQMAAFVGSQRAVQNIQNGDTYSRSGEPQHELFGRMINGAMAEAALAKYLNKYWWKGNKGEADVCNVDVRCTHYENGKLEMHEWDKDDRKYYLLTGMLGSYIIRGWILGKDAKNPKYFYALTTDRPEQYWIPQSDLNKIDWLDD